MKLWRRQWQPTPVLFPGKSHGWRNLVGCSLWGRQESDMTERLHFHFSLSFSNAWKWKVKVKSLSHVWLLAIPLTAAHQVPPSMGFSREEYWSGLPLPSPKFHFSLRENTEGYCNYMYFIFLRITFEYNGEFNSFSQSKYPEGKQGKNVCNSSHRAFLSFSL